MKLHHYSPSSLNLFCAAPAMFILEKVLGRRQPVGVPAHRGTAVEHGVTVGLLNPHATTRECVEEALRKYDTLTALSSDERRAKYRDSIQPLVVEALEELRPYGVPSRVQGRVEWMPDGLEAPIIGYFDYEWAEHGIITDLKTTEALPSKIKTPHARQVGLYAISDNLDARLTYCTPKKRATYRLENVREHRQALHQIALRVERFLALSDDPEFFVSIIAPDLDSFYWAPPEARQAAWETWNI
jgi:hypothetical protein